MIDADLRARAQRERFRIESNSGLTDIIEDGAAFESVVSWFPVPLALVVTLFAFSTMISWSYYGLAGFGYLFGRSRRARLTYNGIFCASVVVGCTAKLDAVLDFSDALVFAMALANVLGLYALAPVVKRDLARYWAERP